MVGGTYLCRSLPAEWITIWYMRNKMEATLIRTLVSCTESWPRLSTQLGWLFWLPDSRVSHPAQLQAQPLLRPHRHCSLCSPSCSPSVPVLLSLASSILSPASEPFAIVGEPCLACIWWPNFKIFKGGWSNQFFKVIRLCWSYLSIVILSRFISH